MRHGIFAALFLATFSTPAFGAGGDLLWGDLHDQAASSEDEARSVAIAGSRVVVAGTTDTLGNVDAVVRVYEAKTGALIWDDVFGTIGVDDEANATAAKGKRAFVGGQTRASGAISESFFLRAYDTRTGAILWQDLKDLTGGVEKIVDLAASGGSVFGLASLGAGAEAQVIAYQGKSGARAWSDRSDFGGTTVFPRAIGISGKRLIVAAEVENTGGDLDFMVRVYDAKSGAFRFQDRVDAGPGDERATAVAGKGKLVYAAGALRGPATQLDFAVRAYDANTGLPLWDVALDGGGSADDGVNGLAAAGKRVFAAGVLAGATEDFAVRAYDGRSGALLWSDTHDASGGVDVAEAVTVAGGAVIAVGRSENGSGDEDFLVRAYAVGSGDLLWEHRFDAAGDADAGKAVAAKGKRVFAVGEGASGDDDIAVRGLVAR